jgi:hypothetical protein
MYAFKIMVTLDDDDKPDDLPGRLDEVTNQLAIMHSREPDFADFMVTRHVSGDATYLIVVEDKTGNGVEDKTGKAEATALGCAVSWLHTAVHTAGFGTPGWLKTTEQVFTPEPEPEPEKVTTV